MTFLLVHGAYHGAWCWERVTPLLERPSVAVDLPGPGRSPGTTETTLDDWADAVVRQAEGDDVVLVAHSFGGMTIPLAAAALGERVRHAVFVSAAVPLPGEDVFDAFPPLVSRLARTTAKLRGRSGVMPPDRRSGARSFCNDMSAELTSYTLERLTPELVRPSLQKAPVTMRDLPGLPSTYAVLEQDRVFSPKRQRQLAARLVAPAVVSLDAGHDAMISRPRLLADLLNGI